MEIFALNNVPNLVQLSELQDTEDGRKVEATGAVSFSVHRTPFCGLITE
jgi:hypothetical protein